jgi:hypothetical protein
VIKALTGGAAFAITATDSTVDLQTLIGCTVAIWCTEQNAIICASAVTPGATIITGATTPSLTSAKGEQIGKGTKAFRLINDRYMTCRTDTGSGTLHFKVVEKPLVTGIGGF